MILLSDQFSRISKTVYTLSFICVGIKFLPIESISAGAFRIDVTNKDTIAGAVGLVVILSTIACVIFLLRDYYLTKIADDVTDDQIGDLNAYNFLKSSEEEVARLTRQTASYEFLSWAGFIVLGIAPITLGILTSIMIWPDMLSFIQNIDGA